MTIPIERERKFLLRPNHVGEDRFRGFPVMHIRQGYLAFDGTECRIRLAPGYEPKVTFKQGSGESRHEVEFKVPSFTGEQLMLLATPYMLTKRRYTTPEGWEVDFFDGGLSEPIAEFEYTPERVELPFEEAANFAIDLRREVTGNPAYLNRNVALRAGVASDAAAGYHLRHIPKGILGQVSKVREELEELEDATIQQNKILQLVELSDLYGAMHKLADNLGVTMDDIAQMAHCTSRAFANGARA